MKRFLLLSSSSDHSLHEIWIVCLFFLHFSGSLGGSVSILPPHFSLCLLPERKSGLGLIQILIPGMFDRLDLSLYERWDIAARCVKMVHSECLCRTLTLQSLWDNFSNDGFVWNFRLFSSYGFNKCVRNLTVKHIELEFHLGQVTIIPH